MNYRNKYLSLIAAGSLAMSATAMAGQVGSMNTFISGSPAVAAEVNANFSEHSSQINDNNARISAIRTGAVSVAPHAFRNENDGEVCNWNTDQLLSYGYFLAGSSATGTCDPVAGVSLPDGVTLTGLNCSVRDNSATNTITPSLRRINMSTATSEIIYTTANSIDDPGIQIVSDSTVATPGYELVDNSIYAYVLTISYSTIDFSSLGAEGRLNGCSITYTP